MKKTKYYLFSIIAIFLLLLMIPATTNAAEEIKVIEGQDGNAGMVWLGDKIQWTTYSSNVSTWSFKFYVKCWNVTIEQTVNGRTQTKTVKVYADGSEEATKGGYKGFYHIDDETTTEVTGMFTCNNCGSNGKYNGKTCAFCNGKKSYPKTKTKTINYVDIETLNKLTGWDLYNGKVDYTFNATIGFNFRDHYNKINNNYSSEVKKATSVTCSSYDSVKAHWDANCWGTWTANKYHGYFKQIVNTVPFYKNRLIIKVETDNGYKDNTISVKTKDISGKFSLTTTNDINEQNKFETKKIDKANIKSVTASATLKAYYNMSPTCNPTVNITESTGDTVVINLTSTPWQHNVKYDLNGGEGNTPAGFIRIYGQPAQIEAVNPMRAGYTFAGWKSNQTGIVYKRYDDYAHLMNGGTDTLIAQWTPNEYTIIFSPNGGSGAEQKITAKTGGDITIINNPFTLDNSTFMNWALNSGAKKADYVPNDIVKVRDLAIASGVQYEAKATIYIYALWDEIPRINANDRYFSLDDANNGYITADELFKKASAHDTEDGDIPRGENFYLESYTPDIYEKWTGEGSCTETFVAIDSVGNVTRKFITVHIVDTRPRESSFSADYQYTRFISLKYLDAAPEDGGFRENSIWKTPELYNELKRVLSIKRINPEIRTYSMLGFTISKEVPGTGEWNDEIVQEWVFTKEDTDAVKAYIDEHGMGNSKEPDALKGFLEEFAHCRIK